MKAARIVVLTVAIAAGGAAALLAGRSDQPRQVKQQAAPAIQTVDVLVAKADIGIGQTVSPGALQWQAWPRTAAAGNFIRKGDRPDAIEKLSGAIARARLLAGEPIRETKLIDAENSQTAAILPSMRAVSTQISPETGASGFILPNDQVDVILTRRDRAAEITAGGEAPISETILGKVRVLAIDQAIQKPDGQTVMAGRTATLELAPQQSETLALAQHLGSLSLALHGMTGARRDNPQADEKPDPRSGSVTVIRFGIRTAAIPR
jgi:pilus assembly protein CpaB